jgi:von Willebrand factor type A domain
MRARVFGYCLAAIIGVGLVGGTGLQAGQAGQKTAFVSVLAGASGPVTGLSAGDFVVKEGKDTREVLGAEPAEGPMAIVLMIDTAQPPQGVQPPTRDLRDGVSAFVKTILAGSPGSQIELLEFAGAATTSVPFTSDGTKLDQTIQRLFPKPQSNAVLIEALVDAGARIAEKPAPRRAIVSVDFRSAEGSAEQSVKKAADSVQKSGATVWAISIGNANSAPARESVLNAVTKSSGGLRLTAFEPSALSGLLAQVANTLLSQYTVTFAHPGSGPVKDLTMEARGNKVQPTAWMR